MENEGRMIEPSQPRMWVTQEMSDRHAVVIEGQCPNGHGALERKDDHGWCGECGMGWSIRCNEVTTHVPLESIEVVGDIGRHYMTPDSRRATRPSTTDDQG